MREDDPQRTQEMDSLPDAEESAAGDTARKAEAIAAAAEASAQAQRAREEARAANTFGAAHLGKITEAYQLIGGVVEKAQSSGEFRSEIPAEFAAMTFYGAIEQMLTGWIFGTLAQDAEAYERAKAHLVGTIVDGLAA